jgi:hypothetical protein
MLTLAAVEEFSKTHEHAIAAVGAVGTVLAAIATTAAVLVSLSLARRSEAVRLRAVLSTDSSKLVILQIDNIGVRVASLAPLFFEWRIPFRRKRQPETMATVINSAYLINRDKITNQITVGSPMNIQVTDIDTFRGAFTRQLPFIDQQLKRFAKIRLKRLGAVIYANDDRHFRMTFSRAMADEIRSLVDAYLWKKTHDNTRR